MKIQLNDNDWFEINTENGGGSISSNFKAWSTPLDVSQEDFNAAVDGIEGLLLAMACEGIPLNTPHMKRSISMALESAANNL